MCLLINHIGDEVDLPFLRRLYHMAFAAYPALVCFLAQSNAPISGIKNRLPRALYLLCLDEDLSLDFFLLDHHIL